MDPTVESALIAVVGTVVVAVTGFLTTWAVTRRTNDAAAESALRARLWERQAAVYIEIIKAVEERISERRERLRLISTGGPFDAFENSTRWHAMFPRLVAYVAPPVRDALDAATEANSRVRDLYEEYSAMPRLDWEAALKRIRTAVEYADRKDQELFETIRIDLRKRPGEARAMTDAPGIWGGAVIGQLEPSQPHNVSHPFNGAGFVCANDGSVLASGLDRMLRAGSTRNHGGPWS